VKEEYPTCGFGIVVTEIVPDGHFLTLLGKELVGILYPDGKYVVIKEKDAKEDKDYEVMIDSGVGLRNPNTENAKQTRGRQVPKGGFYCL